MFVFFIQLNVSIIWFFFSLLTLGERIWLLFNATNNTLLGETLRGLHLFFASKKVLKVRNCESEKKVFNGMLIKKMKKVKVNVYILGKFDDN